MKWRIADIPGNYIQIALVLHLNVNEQRQVPVSEHVKNTITTQSDKLVGFFLTFDKVNNRFYWNLLLVPLLFFIILVLEIAKGPVIVLKTVQSSNG